MKKLVLAALVPMLFGATAASAYVITAEKIPGQPSSSTFSLIGTTTGGSDSGLYTSITYRQQTSPGVTTPFDAWCVEPLVNDTAGPYTYNVSDLFGSSYMGGNSALQAAIERLWTVAEAATGAPTMSTDASLPANWSQLAAAFQISLWELVTDGTSWNFDMGQVQLAPQGTDVFTDNARGLASGWLNSAFETDKAGGFIVAQTRLEYLDTPVNREGKGQDHIRPYIPGQGGDDPLPLPGAAWLALLGVAALTRFRRAA